MDTEIKSLIDKYIIYTFEVLESLNDIPSDMEFLELIKNFSQKKLNIIKDDEYRRN